MGRLCTTDDLTEVQQDILRTVRDFVDEKILPVATDLEHDDEYPVEIVEGMKQLGLFGFTIPEEYGGLGESLLTYVLVVDELARGWMSVSGIVNTHFIVAYMLMQHGTDEQKKHFLPRMAAGEIRGAFSMSEPGCGSDVSAIRTRAVLDDAGDTYVVDGQKMWLTNGGSSTLVAVLVKTDTGADSVYRNMTTFLVEKPAGVRRGRRNDLEAGMANYLASEYCAQVVEGYFRIQRGLRLLGGVRDGASLPGGADPADRRGHRRHPADDHRSPAPRGLRPALTTVASSRGSPPRSDPGLAGRGDSGRSGGPQGV